MSEATNWIQVLAESRFDVSDDGRSLTLTFSGLTPEAAEDMRRFAVASAVACKDIPTEALEAGALGKALDAAQAKFAKVEALQDALDKSPAGSGYVLLAREKRESTEHKALRAALRALGRLP